MFARLLQACNRLQSHAHCKGTHALLIKLGIQENTLLQNKLIGKYAQCGSLDYAELLFDRMKKRTVASWTALINGFVSQGYPLEALDLFREMKNTATWLDSFVFPGIIKACANLFALDDGKCIHRLIIQSGIAQDTFVGNSLTEMYSKCKSPKDAWQVFEKMPERNLVSWNIMISGFFQNGHEDRALCIFRLMRTEGVNPSARTLMSVIPAITRIGCLDDGKEIHGFALKSGFDSDVLVQNAFLDMYRKIGKIEDAFHLFENMPRKDLVSWNSMTAGCAQNGLFEEAKRLILEMEAEGLKANATTWTALIAGYGKFQEWEKAWRVFQHMQLSGTKPDIAAWNALIKAILQSGKFEMAQQVIWRMQSVGMMPDQVTFSSLLSAVSDFGYLRKGREIHGFMLKSGLENDLIPASALVDMYAKCGTIEDSYLLFRKLPRKNVVTWNVMINGLSVHGQGKEAVLLFEHMLRNDLEPDSITFTSLLSACNYAGLVKEGHGLFIMMQKDSKNSISEEHLACYVDLLSRAGLLHEALHVIGKIPFKANAYAWNSLLRSLRIHRDIESGKLTAKELSALDIENPIKYILFSNVYASVGRWPEGSGGRQKWQPEALPK